MVNKQKLELTWIGKDKTIKVEPRILIHDETKDYGDKNTGNMLIYGDNLLALKALEQDYAGKVKCIYIDPPYNTGSAFEFYDDNLEHSTWLNLMFPRLKILRNLLKEDGCIWISIDDTEQAYLKVLCDEIFGRNNFVQTISNQSTPNGRDYGSFAQTHDFIHIYAKNLSLLQTNKLENHKILRSIIKPILKEHITYIRYLIVTAIFIKGIVPIYIILFMYQNAQILRDIMICRLKKQAIH